MAGTRPSHVVSCFTLLFVTCMLTTVHSQGICTKKIDICFVVDQSGSISSQDWHFVQDFVIAIVTFFNIGYDNTRFAMVTFGSQGVVRFGLTDLFTLDDISRAVRAVGTGNGTTNTYIGLNRMRTEVFGQNGDRPNVQNVAIVIMAGRSTENPERTVPEAVLAQQQGILIFAIGLTEHINSDELRAISSPPDLIGLNYWDTPDMEGLQYVLEILQQGNCATPVAAFLGSPGVVRGDVTGSAALEWTMQSEPRSDDAVGFTFNGDDMFRYIPYTGVVIPLRVVQGPDGNPVSTIASYDPRFSIYNTSTSGVGFRLAGLRPEDAGNYTCKYESLNAPITMDAVLFLHDFPGRPVIEASPHSLVEGVTNVSLECGASSMSFPVAHRPAMLYTWNRNGVYIDRTAPPERHAVLGDSGQVLEISPVHHTDTTYTCTASESGTQLTSEETEITLDVLHGPYNLMINPSKPSARDNEVLVIRASADCKPACSFTWSTGDDAISQSILLLFDKFQSRDTNNYTVRAANAYGAADLGVEVTLDNTMVPDEGPAANPSDSENIIIGILAAVACVSITIGIVLVTLAFRRWLVVCKKGDREPASSTLVYANAGRVREPGYPVADYVNCRTDMAYEDVSPTPREPAHLSDMVPEDGLDSVPVTTGEHHSPGVGGVYEPVDQRTREPARPADKVYAALRNASA